ncbi:MAG: PQQ-binding-like beta-propeller repeat protein [Thermomicrobiales bacterium]
MPISPAKTEAPLIEPSKNDDRTPRTLTPVRHNMLKANTVLQQRYRIIEVLGVGGMSTVYKARDLRFTSVDRLCAIKEMFNVTDDERVRSLRLINFQREAALLATLTHSAIPRIYDYFEQQGTVYLVLELIQGHDLESLLSQRGEAFSEDAVVGWALDLCSVLIYLHSQQPEPVIFRDLKPSNIMIRSDSALMLVDFGIARAFAPQQKGTMIGTEGYAPPEQYRGIADARGDIYALGATLHHLSTASDPRGETPFTFAQRPPRRFNGTLSAEFEHIVLKCVQYSADDRYGSVQELRDTLLELRHPGTGAIGAVTARRRDHTRGSAVLATGAGQKSTAPNKLDQMRLDWSLKTQDEVRGSASHAGGAIYVGSYDGSLYAIDETDGSVRWRYRAQRGIVSRPVPANDVVLFGSEDHSLYAVSRQAGRSTWSFRTNMPVRSSPAVDDKAAYIGSDDSFLYRVDRARGTLLWRYRTWGPVRSSPLVSGDHIVFGSDDGYFYAVHRESGQLGWRYQIGAPLISSPARSGDLIVVGAMDGGIRGFGAEGKLKWTHTTQKAIVASPLIVDQTVYIGSCDGHLYALALDSGEVTWKSHLCRQITSSATHDGEVLYVGGTDSKLYCLTRDDGSVKWSFSAEGPIVSRPLITADHVVFGSMDGRVYALDRHR